MRIICAIVLGIDQTDLLKEVGWTNILMSYAHLRDDDPGLMAYYQKHGTIPAPKNSADPDVDFSNPRYRQFKAVALAQRASAKSEHD